LTPAVLGTALAPASVDISLCGTAALGASCTASPAVLEPDQAIVLSSFLAQMVLAAIGHLDPANVTTDRSRYRLASTVTTLTICRVQLAVSQLSCSGLSSSPPGLSRRSRSFSRSPIRGLLISAGLVTASADGRAPWLALFLGVIHVGLGVKSGALGVRLGVRDALAGTVSFIAGIGSDVHDLMEHGPSE